MLEFGIEISLRKKFNKNKKYRFKKYYSKIKIKK